MNYKYVFVCYARSAIESAEAEIAIVMLGFDSDGRLASVSARIDPDWKSSVLQEDVYYLSLVWQDLETLSLADAEGLFRSFSEMSTGPLRTGRSGECSSNELAAILSSSVFARAS